MPQAERQRRWYLNLTEEQREARRECQIDYWHRRGSNLRQARRIEEHDPEFAAYLRGEITFEDLTPLPKARPLD